MRVLVTGASGYLGAAMLRYLDAERPDWDVHATFFSIPPSDGYPNAHALDLRNRDSVERMLDEAEPDLIFHAAALNAGDADEMYKTNGLGSSYIAQGAVKRGTRLVHLSSDVIFDGKRGNYTEDDAPNPITPYAISKAEAERGVLASGANAVLVRTSLIYGFKPLDPRMRAILRGEMPRLFTDEMRCPIGVFNLAEALVELSELDYRGIINVAGTQPLSRYDFGVKLMESMKADASALIPTPSSLSRVVRPMDCTLDVSRARKLLKTKLLGVDEMLTNR